MHAVVNHLRTDAALDAGALAAFAAAVPRLRAIDGFVALHLVQVDPTHAIVIVLGDGPEALARISDEVGGAWVTEHVAPHLTAPPDRVVGEVVATTAATSS